MFLAVVVVPKLLESRVRPTCSKYVVFIHTAGRSTNEAPLNSWINGQTKGAAPGLLSPVSATGPNHKLSF